MSSHPMFLFVCISSLLLRYYTPFDGTIESVNSNLKRISCQLYGLGARITLAFCWHLVMTQAIGSWQIPPIPHGTFVVAQCSPMSHLKSSDSRSTICKLLLLCIYSTLDAPSFHPSHHPTHFLEHYKPPLSLYPRQHALPRTSNYSPRVYAYDPIH